jgi:mono/diheme cytochrome c family protein
MVRSSAGGYGDVNPCNAIVHSAVTVVTPSGEVKTGPALPGLVLAVDLALSRDGGRVAMVAMGNAHNSPSNGVSPAARVVVTDLGTVSNPQIGCPARGVGIAGSCGTTSPPLPTATADGGTPSSGDGGQTAAADAGAPLPPTVDAGVPPAAICNSPDVQIPQVVGEPIAVAFAGDQTLIVQSREPALLAFGDGTTLSLSTDSRADTGHLVFHANTGSGVACASCHAEGDDDGRVWNFDCSGARRTQSLQTGLRGTEPFHWSGDETDLSKQMSDVFVGRMSGPVLSSEQMDVLLSWIDGQPRLPAQPVRDKAAADRGRVLFEDAKRAACATCHNGARFSNNATVDVGTGAPFQVPSLLGIGSRGPFMHDGCAGTLRDRFSPTCGGTAHGGIGDLSGPRSPTWSPTSRVSDG